MAALKKLRIVSDGTGAGTRILDSEGNEILGGYARSITWKVGPETNRIAQVIVELVPAELEVVALLAPTGGGWRAPQSVGPEHTPAVKQLLGGRLRQFHR